MDKLSREELEQHFIKTVKSLKTVQKRCADLESELRKQLDENAILSDENERLKNEPKLGAFDIGKIGKTLTSIIKRTNTEFEFVICQDSVDMKPCESQESPELVGLRQAMLKAQSDEAVHHEFVENLQKKLQCQESAISDRLDEIAVLKSENEDLRAKMEKMDAEISSLNGFIQRLEGELADAKCLSQQVPELVNSHEQLRELTQKYAILEEQYENIKRETIGMRVEKEEKDRNIENLKETVQRLRIDIKDRESQIRGLENDIKELSADKSDIEQQIDGVKELVSLREKEISSLKSEIAELNDRIEHGRGSTAAEAKVAQMQRMLEKSNALYADVHERAAKNEARVKELERHLHEAKSLGDPLVCFSTPVKNYVLCKNGRFYEGKGTPAIEHFVCNAQKTEEKGTQVSVQSEETKDDAYLKSLIIQYFRADDKSRKQMTPVILSVIGLNDIEARAIMSDTRGRNRFSFFGS